MQLSELIKFINSECLAQYNTVLAGGFDEPVYLPVQRGNPAVIRFTRDYYRSALHELAHWCIAGIQRRQLEDYGYWYAPDGRDQVQQQEFYACELKPQAVEKAFSKVCGIEFDVSTDNLNNNVSGELEFRVAVENQYEQYLLNGFPARADKFLQLIYKVRFGDGGSVSQYLTSGSKVARRSRGQPT